MHPQIKSIHWGRLSLTMGLSKACKWSVESGYNAAFVTHASVHDNEQQGVLASPGWELDMVNAFASLLQDTEIESLVVLKEPGSGAQSVNERTASDEVTHSGQVKNSGISSRTSPRRSSEAEA